MYHFQPRQHAPKDRMLLVQPRRRRRRDEELREADSNPPRMERKRRGEQPRVSLTSTFTAKRPVRTHLGAVRVRTCVGHRQEAGLGVPEREVLVCDVHAHRVQRIWGTPAAERLRTCELLAVDRLPPGAVVSCEVTTLEHELDANTR